MSKEILNKVGKYYSDKISVHGATPKGVDWNGEQSQVLRFKQLLRVCDNNDSYSLLDFGCGYGALLDYLIEDADSRIDYSGFDISAEMISAAKIKFNNKFDFFTELNPELKFDFIVASGIFNVRQETPDAEWEKYILDTLELMNKHSVKGFSFNVLTSYSDKEFMHDYLYYASPEKLFSYCKTQFSKQVALLHDYQLYEFTILVKK
ncbi:MAG: class I SAM-dependent methyltransferase [Bacteroidia bacterium]